MRKGKVMPAKSPEAIERKRENRKRATLSKKLEVAVKTSDFPAQKVIKRRMLGRCTLSKAELMGMLSEAVKNTR
jgi:hypothetical protein